MLVILAAAAGGTYLKIQHDNKVRSDREERAERRRKATAEQEEKRRAAAEEDRRFQADLDKLERTVRRGTVKSLEKAITEDAQQSVNDGVLDGPILRTECDPAPGETPMDVSVETSVYDCLAIYKEDTDGTASGWTYTGNINFETGRYSWSLGKD